MLRTNKVLAILLATVLALFSFGTFKAYAADISAPGWFKATVTNRTLSADYPKSDAIPA